MDQRFEKSALEVGKHVDVLSRRQILPKSKQKPVSQK